MNHLDAGRTVPAVASATATPWFYGVWFGFTYLPPAALVGGETRMR